MRLYLPDYSARLDTAPVFNRHVCSWTRHEQFCDCDEPRFTCVASEEWPKFYCGSARVKMRRFDHEGKSRPITFCFPEKAGVIVRMFLLCRYEIVYVCCEERKRRHMQPPEIVVENRRPIANL